MFFDADNGDVLWFCPLCNDGGRISGWQDAFWISGYSGEATA